MKKKMESTGLLDTYTNVQVRLSFRKIVKGGQNLNIENFGWQCIALHTNCLGGSRGMPPRDFWGI